MYRRRFFAALLGQPAAIVTAQSPRINVETQTRAPAGAMAVYGYGASGPERLVLDPVTLDWGGGGLRVRQAAVATINIKRSTRPSTGNRVVWTECVADRIVGVYVNGLHQTGWAITSGAIALAWEPTTDDTIEVVWV